MTPFWLLIAVTSVAAISNWWAVANNHRTGEIVAKPLTLAALVVAAAVLPDPTPPGAHPWFLAALILSLAGDVFLLERDGARFFLFGLGSFLIAHALYVVGLLRFDLHAPGLIVGGVLVLAAAVTIGRRIVTAAARTDKALAGPVALYLVAISTMVVLAVGTGHPVAIAGALLFFCSDAVLGWDRFVHPLRHGHLAVMVTYHLGQLGLVLALVPNLV